MELSDGSDGFGSGSAKFLPSKFVNPDLDALEDIEAALLLPHWTPVDNELHMKEPKVIAEALGKCFYSDDLDLLTSDKIDTPFGSWKMPDRGQGWGIADTYEQAFERWRGWRRTFVYNPIQHSKSNKRWHMNVYATIGDDLFVKPLYRCVINEVHNFNNPYPKCVSQLYPTGFVPIPLSADPGETESLAQQLEAICTSPSLLPFVEHQDYKNKTFETIKARGTDGKDIKWSICNHCGMVYKGIPNKAVKDNHKCKCGCNLASSS